MRGALDAIAVNAAHAVFSQHRGTGVAILLALLVYPRCLALALCALAGSALLVRALRLHNPFLPYGYTAILCGIAVGREYLLEPVSCAFALALGAGSVLVTAALAAAAGYLGYLPVLSLPFVLTAWLGSSVAPGLPLMAAGPQLDAWAAALPPPCALALQSLGAFVLLPDVRVGLCVLGALLLHSRIATVLATLAVVQSLALLRLTGVPLADSTTHWIGASAGLTAIAIGSVWLVPSGRASLVALGGALLSVFFALGLVTPLARLGIPLAFVPFVLAVLVVLSALRQRPAEVEPRLSTSTAASPEEVLANDTPLQPAAAGAVQLRLPFSGAWCCTQGVDGPYTHRGVLRHAYDFELYGPDGALCSGTGIRPEDYHCFNKPVLAAAEGKVVAVENTVPNSAIGEADSVRPWGNYVVLQHGPALYSLVAHLGPGTVVVYPGQFVWRGQVLGYCGSSGRAPRPHLHFQLQASAELGSATEPSCFADVVVRRVGPPRYEPSYVPQQGDVLETLQPDYALSAHFQFPLGVTLTYDSAGRQERIVSEIDGWGRSVLRSLDRKAELVVTRTESSFRCVELRGTQNSVLRLLRLSLAHVPFERRPELVFRSVVPLRWLGGWARRAMWDLRAPFAGPQRIELVSQVAVEPRGLAIVGHSNSVETRAVFGAAPGPQLVEVSAFGRTERAELVVQQLPMRRRASSEANAQPTSTVAVGAGGWS